MTYIKNNSKVKSILKPINDRIGLIAHKYWKQKKVIKWLKRMRRGIMKQPTWKKGHEG
jgi:hypothetical protein